MRRLFILGTIFVGLLVAFGVAGEDGFQTPRRAEATSTITTWMYPTSGGIQVPGGGPTTTTALGVAAPCTNCYITAIVPDLVYMNDPDPINHADGSTANFNNNSLDNVWLHHMVVVDECSPSFSYRVFSSGNERTTWSLPAGYGYFQAACAGASNTVWAVNYHIHNSSSATRGVALKLVITWTTDTLTPVTPVWLDISNSGNSEYQVPDGLSDTHTGSGGSISPDWTTNLVGPNFQGQIVAIGGHVHDYGISVSAENLRLKDYICTSTSGYGTGSRYLPTGGPGTPGHPTAGNPVVLNGAYHEANGTPDDRYHIQAMTTCTPTPAQSIICKNDVIRLHTQYNNGSGFPIFDAMGIIVVDVATNLPDSNGSGTIDACKDNDGDLVVNSADNCPDWPNPAQNLPVWSVPAGDTDCDGFPSTVKVGSKASESFLGTDPTRHCAADSIPNNEPLPDAWPFDFNDDQLAGLADVAKYSSVFGSHSPGPPYAVRFDLNGDGLIGLGDVAQFSSVFGKRCAP